MSDDLVVLGQDPRFGGGASAQTGAFLSAATALGRAPRFVYDQHPGLRAQRLTWRRVEALRQLASARRLRPDAQAARSLWVVAALAQNGAAAARAHRPYGCWAGTTIRSEWSGRAPGLTPARRLAAGASIPVLELLERRVLRRATRVFATSPASRAAVAKAAGCTEDEVGILPIPIDLDRFAPAPDEVWSRAAAKPVLVFVGRADDPRKNVPMLLEAFADVRRRFPAARLHLVGRPPSGVPPDGVELFGEVTDVAAELTRAALFVLPSRQEGFGIVAAEAMAAGLPVVTTPSGGPEDLVRRSGGGAVAAAHSADALAAAISELAAAPDTLAEMRRSGRQHVEREHSLAAFRAALASALADVDAA